VFVFGVGAQDAENMLVGPRRCMVMKVGQLVGKEDKGVASRSFTQVQQRVRAFEPVLGQAVRPCGWVLEQCLGELAGRGVQGMGRPVRTLCVQGGGIGTFRVGVDRL
jgi:hypothetical protein